jgi:hypothetical protein
MRRTTGASRLLSAQYRIALSMVDFVLAFVSKYLGLGIPGSRHTRRGERMASAPNDAVRRDGPLLYA